MQAILIIHIPARLRKFNVLDSPLFGTVLIICCFFLSSAIFISFIPFAFSFEGHLYYLRIAFTYIDRIELLFQKRKLIEV